MAVINIKNINRVIDKGKPKKIHRGWQVRPKDVRRLQRWDKFNLNNAKQVWKNFEEMGLFALNGSRRNGDWTGVKNAWQGHSCFVVGSSISARGFDLTKLDGHKSIGVNHMIEYYDRFTFFLFQDHRFLRLTKYNLKNYKGHIFCHNSAPVLPSDYEKVTFFKTQYNRGTELSMNPEDGLYTRCLTGLSALHLALITGASPIYLIGMDTPQKINLDEGHHYEKDYIGEIKNETSLKGTINKYILLQHFSKWKDRIINVCPNGRINYFKKISINDLNKILEKKC